MRALMVELPEPLIGVTSLAIGADSIFAESVLQHKGSIEAVIPFPEYELTFDIDDRDRYRRLLKAASRVMLLQKKRSDEESYLEAGKMVVDLTEMLLAVWDGKPARGLGGTGDIVEYAVRKRKDIFHLNPITHRVTRLKSLPR